MSAVNPFRISLHAGGGRTADADLPPVYDLLRDVILKLGESIVGPVLTVVPAQRADEVDLILQAAFEDNQAADRAASALLSILMSATKASVGRFNACAIAGELATARRTVTAPGGGAL